MTPISRQEVENLLQNKPTGMTDRAVIEALVQKGYQPEGMTIPGKTPSEPGIGERVGRVIESAGGQVRQAITGEGEFSGESPLARGFGAAAAAAGAIPSTAIQAIPQWAGGEQIRGGLEAVGGFLGNQFDKVTGAIGSTQFMQQAAGYQDVDPETGAVTYVPNDLGWLEEGLNIAQRAGEVSDVVLGSGLGPKAVTTGVASTANITKNIASNTLKTGKNLAERATPKTWRATLWSNAPETRTKAVDTLEEAYRSSLVEGRKSTLNKLDNLAAANSFAGNAVTPQSLIRELAEEGYVPKIDGSFARFDDVFDDISTRQKDLMGKINQELAPLQGVETRASLERLRADAESLLRQAPQIGAGLDASLSQLNRMFESLANKYGDSVTPSQLNDIRKEMNKLTTAYKAKGGEQIFEFDAADAVGKVTRSVLDEKVPSGLVSSLNREWARLERVSDTARVLHNEIVDVGLIGRKLGSYVGTIGASLAGLSVAGPGGLVVASIFAQLGSDAIATLLRSRKFNPELRKTILDEIAKEPATAKKIIEEASPENKSFLASLFQSAKENLEDPAMRQGGYAANTPDFPGKGKLEKQIAEIDRQMKSLNDALEKAESRTTKKGTVAKRNSEDVKSMLKKMGSLQRKKDNLLAEGDSLLKKAKGATPPTTLLEEAKKYKSAEEFVKAQGTPVYHGTTKEAAQSIAKTGFREGKEASELGKGVYVTSDKTPANLFGNRGEVIEAYVPNIDTYELPDFARNPQVESTRIANAIIGRGTLPPTLKGMTVDELAERIRSVWSTDNARFWLEKAGYDGITDATSQVKGQTVIFDPTKIKTRTQLEDIWNKANGAS